MVAPGLVYVCDKNVKAVNIFTFHSAVVYDGSGFYTEGNRRPELICSVEHRFSNFLNPRNIYIFFFSPETLTEW